MTDLQSDTSSPTSLYSQLSRLIMDRAGVSNLAVNTCNEQYKKYEDLAKELFTTQNANMDGYYDTKVSLESAISALEQECEAVSLENRHYHTAENVRRGLDAQSRMMGLISAHAEAENYLRSKSVGSTGVL